LSTVFEICFRKSYFKVAGEIKEVEARAGIRLRDSIIIPLDSLFRYLRNLRIDSGS